MMPEDKQEMEAMRERIEKLETVTGSPVKPGLFAWTKYVESGGATSQGTFFTSISGPKGDGTVDATFYHSPAGNSLGIWFTSHGEEIQVYNGRYPCKE